MRCAYIRRDYDAAPFSRPSRRADDDSFVTDRFSKGGVDRRRLEQIFGVVREPPRLIVDLRFRLYEAEISESHILDGARGVLRKLAEGMTIEDLLDGYPRITRDDVHAAIQFAAHTLAHEEVVFRPTGTER